jgi:hypothetical protein
MAVGYRHWAGIGTQQSCSDALPFYKSAAEKGSFPRLGELVTIALFNDCTSHNSDAAFRCWTSGGPASSATQGPPF